MKILLTGAEVICLTDKYYVVYQERILTKLESKEKALMLAINESELQKFIRKSKWKGFA